MAPPPPERERPAASGALIYAMVARGTVAVAEHTSYTGNFRDIAAQCLHDEVRDDTAVVGAHVGAVRVEDSRYLDFHVVSLMKIEEQRLGAALALVVAGPGAERIDIAPIILDLRVHERVAIDFGGGCLENAGAGTSGQFQQVECTEDRRLHRVDRIGLVVRRRCRAGKVVDFIDLDVDRIDDVMPDDAEAVEVAEMADIALKSG